MRTLVPMLALLAWMTPGRAHACRCQEISLDEERARSTAIFEGRVRRLSPSGGGGPVRVLFEVVQSFRGADHEQVEVVTAGTSAACGVSFEPDRSYLVFAQDAPEGGLRTGLCSRTRPMEEAGADRAALGSGVIPVDIADRAGSEVEPRLQVRPRAGCAGCRVGGEDPGAPAAGLLLAGLACVTRARRRRARIR